jgi:hypothetical protein
MDGKSRKKNSKFEQVDEVAFFKTQFEQVDGGRKVLFSHYIVYTYITYNRMKVKGNYET